MIFDEVTSQLAMAILSHYTAIAQLVDKKVVAYVKGDGEADDGELVFCLNWTRIEWPPTKGKFTLGLNDGRTSVKTLTPVTMTEEFMMKVELL